MLKQNPACGCGEEAICNETELICHPCCRCIPLRLCASLTAYSCDCDGVATLLELDENNEYVGSIGCENESIDLLIYVFHENEVCYWRLVSEAADVDEFFEISPYGQSCEWPDLEVALNIGSCSVVLSVRRYDLDRLKPRLVGYGYGDDECEEVPWCGSCHCVCRTLCVVRDIGDEITQEELLWDEYTWSWGDIFLLRDETTGECVVQLDGFDPIVITDCGVGLAFTFKRGCGKEKGSGLIIQANALGFRTTSIYDAGGRGVAAVAANGGRSTTVYDTAGRAAASVNPLRKRWTTVYNTVGQTVGSKDPLGNRSTSVFDSAGRVVAVVNPLGKRTTTVYNIASQNLATVDANGHRVSSVCHALGRRTVEINALGYRTTTIYDSVGQTSALVDARGNRHSFTYDATGVQTPLIGPLNRSATSAYLCKGPAMNYSSGI